MMSNIILACDFSPGDYRTMLDILARSPSAIYGIKLGFGLCLRAPLQSLTYQARQINHELVIIYDHQKAGTDVPFTGELFAEVMAEAKVDKAILFPLAGPASQKDWTQSLQKKGIVPISGGSMTHQHFYMEDGGYIEEGAVAHMYRIGAKLGVTEYVMPGNHLDRVKLLIDIVLENGCPEDQLKIYSPGLSSLADIQAWREITQPYKAYPIIGRMIYNSDNPVRTAEEINDLSKTIN